ncbi:hypothetical protein Q8F55_006367 [Vanrija albida]|uniref:Zn(2)-C6 fungal-type domain-containing protein n=1 Tax=Vanrija albida TaxID=181172 RepID=A0ABR3PX36_9TREE
MPPAQSSAADEGRRKGHTRRKDGCLTCRKRRVGCTRERPQCAHCTRLSLKCTWPVEADVNDPNHQPLRRRAAKSRSRSPVRPATATATDDKWQQSWGAASVLPLLADVAASAPLAQAPAVPPLPLTQLPPGLFDFALSAPEDPFGLGTVDLAAFPRDALDAAVAASLNVFGGVPPVIPFTPIASTSSSSTPAAGGASPVVLQLEDQPYIAFYLERSSQWAKMRGPHLPNHFLSVFAVSLFFPPLYLGILAWSALSLGLSLPSLDARREQALTYAQAKHEACFLALSAHLASDSTDNIEPVLSAIKVYCQYEIGLGNDPSSIQGLLDLAKYLCVRPAETLAHLSVMGQRMAVLLSSFDVRASMFHRGKAEYTFELAHSLLDTELADSWHPESMQLLRLNHFSARCIRLDGALRDGREKGNTDAVRKLLADGDELFAALSALQDKYDGAALDGISSLTTSDAPAPKDMQPTPQLVTLCLLGCLYNMIVIYLCRILGLPPPARAAERIYAVSRNLAALHPDVASTVFHRPLFFAGLEAKDDEQFDWIVNRLGETARAGGGHHVHRTVGLLVRVRELEREGGTKQDISAVLLREQKKFIM